MVALKMCAPGRAHLEKHYADLSKKPFFKDLVDYMVSGPIIAMVWEGLNAVKCGRMMLGETNPQASLPGSIRGDFSIQVSALNFMLELTVKQGWTQHLPWL
jgi:nucleoside-diphosphate kinase